MAKEKNITGVTHVWSAAAWWPDSDPSMQAVALTARRANSALAQLMKEAARYAYDEETDGSGDLHRYPSVAAAYRSIRSSGPHAFKLGDLASSRELNEAIQALEEDGVWYPPGS